MKRPTGRIVACEHWNARYVPVSGFERCRLAAGDVFRVLRLVANQLRWFSPAYELTLTCTLGQGACDATEQLRMQALAY